MKDRLKAIGQAVAAMEKNFGKGTIMRLGDEPITQHVPVISTGSISVDHILGIGGLPCGRIIEVYGPEASGKTTLTLHTIAACHRAGGMAAFIDAEHALDVSYAKSLGIDPDKLYISQPDSGEQALEICDALVRSGTMDLVVIDSVAALVPRAEIEGEMGDAHMGLQARLMSQALRKLTATINRTQTTVVFINQLRHKIGVAFGNPEVTTGGNALKFYCSVRIEVRRIGAIKSGDQITGNRTRIKVVKNKLAPPFRTAEVDIVYGKGIWPTAELLERAIDEGLVERAGSWLSFKGEQLGQGRDRVAQRLDDEPALRDQLLQATRQKLGLDQPKSGDLDAKAA